MATENPISLLTKWVWQIATRQRTALLITGRPDQHIGVDVGLERAPACPEPLESLVEEERLDQPERLAA